MTNIFLDSYIFRDINKYTDLRNLCDTCSSLSKLKKYINYKLNKQYSLMYYNNILFKTMILNKIFNPRKQLQLNLSFYDTINAIVLDNVYSLDLSNCNSIINISELKNVKILDLSNCKNIIDINCCLLYTSPSPRD